MSNQLSLTESLNSNGWTVIDGFLDQSLLSQLHQFIETAYQKQRFKKAKIGRHAQKNENREIRTDSTLWYGNEFPALNEKLSEIQHLLNRELFLGINHCEFHFAIYEPGGFYEAHVDQFNTAEASDGERLISLVLYLNPIWNSYFGGELLIHHPEKAGQILKRIEPISGRLVLFDSKRVLHSVAPTFAQRLSFTGWFRRERVIPISSQH